MPTTGELPIGQWNVEGLTPSKVVQLQQVMRQRKIGIICMQETHLKNSDYYIDNVYLVILSGSTSEGREPAGVGFIGPLAPSIRHWLQAGGS